MFVLRKGDCGANLNAELSDCRPLARNRNDTAAGPALAFRVWIGRNFAVPLSSRSRRPTGPSDNLGPAVNAPLLSVFHWLEPEQRAGLLVGQQVQ